MFSKHSTIPALSAISLSLIVAACGGGGGGGGNTAQPASTNITSANQNQVAGVAFEVGESLSNTAFTAGQITGISGVQVRGKSGVLNNPAIFLLKNVLEKQPQSMASGVVETIPCDLAGSITIDANVRSEEDVTVGDRVSFAASGCRFTSDETYSGNISIRVTGVRGEPFVSSTYGLDFAGSYSNFSVAYADGFAQTLNGDMNLSADVLTTSESIRINGSALNVVETINGTTVASTALHNYSATFDLAANNEKFAINGGTSGSRSSLGNFSYTFETVTPFITDSADFYPASGKLLVRGASSSLALTALNDTTVRLEFSEKGDGVITSTTDKAWSDFDL